MNVGAEIQVLCRRGTLAESGLPTWKIGEKSKRRGQRVGEVKFTKNMTPPLSEGLRQTNQ
jgi:hypothetical protein